MKQKDRPVFRFKRFVLEQIGAAHPVGTDSVLLGAWADIQGVRHILDIGTGTGAVALLLAQRTEGFLDCQLVGLEPHAPSLACAVGNFSRSSWAKRLIGVEGTAQNYAQGKDRPFDLIVSNPPFFVETPVSPDPIRRAVRHVSSLPPNALLEAVSQLLAPQGRFCVIVPPSLGQHLCEWGVTLGLYCTRRTVVFARPGKPPERWLLCFERSPYQFQQKHLYIYEREEIRSAEFRALTGDFYF